VYFLEFWEKSVERNRLLRVSTVLESFTVITH